MKFDFKIKSTKSLKKEIKNTIEIPLVLILLTFVMLRKWKNAEAKCCRPRSRNRNTTKYRLPNMPQGERSSKWSLSLPIIPLC